VPCPTRYRPSRSDSETSERRSERESHPPRILRCSLQASGSVRSTRIRMGPRCALFPPYSQLKGDRERNIGWLSFRYWNRTSRLRRERRAGMPPNGSRRTWPASRATSDLSCCWTLTSQVPPGGESLGQSSSRRRSARHVRQQRKRRQTVWWVNRNGGSLPSNCLGDEVVNVARPGERPPTERSEALELDAPQPAIGAPRLARTWPNT
jgi:hypothetical protein